MEKMRRKIRLVLTAAAGALLLTACTSSGNTDMQEAVAQVSGSDTSASSGQDSASDGRDDSIQEASGQKDSAPSIGASGSSTDTGTSDSDTVSGDSAAQEAGASSGQDNGEGAAAGEFDGLDQVPGEDETGVVTGDIWTGTYGNDSETLTVIYIDSGTISFAFAQSGISGKAEVNGYYAVYKGDDHHVVVFDISDNVIEVSVSNEEDYDTAASPLIGTYVKDYVASDA